MHTQYALGLHFEKEAVLAALLQKDKDKFNILSLHSLPLDVSPKEALSSELEDKEVKIVTGLPAQDVVRREVSMKLKSEKKILEALPFQIESVIPYPMDAAVILPFLYPKEKESTDVVLIATTKTILANHLKNVSCDPDVVSSIPAALTRFCQFFFPEQTALAMIHKDTGICVREGKLLLTQTLQHSQERMHAYIQLKCPDAFFVPLESDITHGDFNFSKLQEFAIPIGLALDALQKDGRSTQFRQEEFTAPKAEKKETIFVKSFLAACLGLYLIVFGVNTYFLGKTEKSLQARLDSFLGLSGASLFDRTESWEASLVHTKKPLSKGPRVSDVLAWVSSKKEEIDLARLHYHNGRLEIEFTSPSPTTARDFHEKLLQGDPFINPKGEVQWKVSQNHYFLTFTPR